MPNARIVPNTASTTTSSMSENPSSCGVIRVTALNLVRGDGSVAGGVRFSGLIGRGGGGLGGGGWGGGGVRFSGLIGRAGGSLEREAPRRATQILGCTRGESPHSQPVV